MLKVNPVVAPVVCMCGAIDQVWEEGMIEKSFSAQFQLVPSLT